MDVSLRLGQDINVQVCNVRMFNTFKDHNMGDQMRMQGMVPIGHHFVLFKISQVLGLRFGGAMIFEQQVFFNVVWFLANQFHSQKNWDRFALCVGDYARVKEVVYYDLSVMPECLGGGLKDVEYDWVVEQGKLETRKARFSTALWLWFGLGWWCWNMVVEAVKRMGT